ncbi:MAG: M15 family metallopeptidase [Oscillospiraceae bacterium]|nr:M15 family metallopeptidase [Oscillospiraceae bacterium]
MKRKNKRRKYLLLQILLFIGLAAFSFICIQNLREEFKDVPAESRGEMSEEWYLVLVNHENPIPENYAPELTVLDNGRSVDSRIYPDLQKMFDDMRAEGIYPVVGEGYRTSAEQRQIMNEKVEAYINDGFPRKRAEALAENEVAAVGKSEHQLGLAVDINADKALSDNDDVYNWLAQNAYKYGFILRYPSDKINITGIDFEPWHYRYVGEEAAKEIYERGICLEEYLG